MDGKPAIKQQRGATAVEFAFVLPVFFMLFYAILSYGLIFLMRLGLQHAAEDGVRAALRYQQVTYASGSTQQQRRQAQLQARVAWGQNVAAAQARWMNGWHVPEIRANVCVTGVACVPSTGPAVYPDCNASTTCQIVITVTYPYDTAPVLPSLPGFGVLVPDSLQGRARALLDGRALSS